MKLNYFKKSLSTVGRFMVAVLLFVSAVTFTWQGAFLSNTSAMAAPNTNLIAASGTGDKIQGKASEDAGRTKNFVRDTANKVERTAKKNASRVDQATDDGSFVERKAKRDAARIEKRAEKDTARTQSAIDKTKNAVQRAVDGVKDAFD
jgi:uncharacterized protein YjbJ (UPF0337 family)